MRVNFILISGCLPAMSAEEPDVDQRARALPVVDRAPEGDTSDLRLGDVPLQQEVELVHIDMPADLAEPLLERGVLPGCRICPVRNSPAGDPIISIDGSLIALRKETADCLCVRILSHFQEAN